MAEHVVSIHIIGCEGGLSTLYINGIERGLLHGKAREQAPAVQQLIADAQRTPAIELPIQANINGRQSDNGCFYVDEIIPVPLCSCKPAQKG